MKVLLVLAALIAMALARPEAPVDRSYLPPANSGHRNGAPAPVYGPPSAANRQAATEDPLAVPASYKFDYKVQDDEAGLDFGHQEEREGEEAKGEYRVLLPDGRRLVVTYTANGDGYQPEVKFEEAQQGGYPRSPAGGRY